jgi:hypothetical protein
LGLWLVVALVRRQEVRSAVVLAVSALLGLVVLKVVLGSGSGQSSSLLQSLGPSPTIRNLSWAFPFLAQPLRPFLGHLGPTNLMKLGKFASVYLVAVWFYLVGSLWVRMVLMPHAHRFRREWIRTAEGGFLACVVVSAILLATCVDFNKLAYQGAQYDAFRFLWIPLLLANLGVAAVAVLHSQWLRRGWGLLVVLLFVFYGSWENTQLVLWSRTALPYSVIRASQMKALRYLDQHAGPEDLVLTNPRTDPPQPRDPLHEPMTHHWGYYSGLLNARLYLDNEDMARKFGQGRIWDTSGAAERAGAPAVGAHGGHPLARAAGHGQAAGGYQQRAGGVPRRGRESVFRSAIAMNQNGRLKRAARCLSTDKRARAHCQMATASTLLPRPRRSAR